jgi:hypothetical protein
MPAPNTMDPMTMAAVQHSAQGLQDVKGFGLGLLQNRWNRKYNEKMYDKQRADALSDWQRAADYNSPQAQMIRYKQAGLNPNLIYGSATNSPMAQMRNPDLQTSELPPQQINRNSIGDSIGTFQNLKLNQQQVDNLEATNEQIRANTNYINLKALTELYKPDLVQAQTDTERTRPGLYRSQAAGIDARRNLDLQKYNFLSQMNPHLLNLVQERINNIVSQTGLNQAKTQMVPGMIALNAERLLLTQAQTAKTWNENEHITEAIKLTKSKTFMNDMENILRMQGTTFKDGAVTRGLYTGGTTTFKIPNSIEKVYKTIVPGWDKMSDTDKMYYIMHESLNK